MPRKCCVPACRNKQNDIILHKFPVNKELCNVWLQKIKCDTLKMDHMGILRMKFVCHNHFEKRFVNASRRLKIGAYPTLFTEQEMSTGNPSGGSSSYVPSCKSDHSYTYKNWDHSYCATAENRSAVRGLIPDDDHPATSSPLKSLHGLDCPSTSDASLKLLPKPSVQIESGMAFDASVKSPPGLDHPSTSYASVKSPPGLDHPSTSYASVKSPPGLDPPSTSDANVKSPPGLDHQSISNARVKSLPALGHASTSDASLKSPPGPSMQIELDATPHRYNKKRLIRDVKSLTPRCRLLYKEYKIAKRQKNFNTRAKKAMDFSKEKSFAVLTNKINPLAKKLLWMQVKLCTKSKNARRFTLEEKLIALAIYKQSPKSYKFLQRIFILPSKTTLKKMIGNLNIDIGINPQLFELIKEEVQDWNEQKRLCTIIFDEMAIEPAVNYNPKKDQIDGIVHLNASSQFADQALVFMLRGAVHKWQQPIAYYFSEGQTKSAQLKTIIKDVVSAVTETGLQPIALVSDQGTSFQCALNALLEDTKGDQLRAGETVDNTIHLCGNSISVVYDPPHLIKGMRNNLLSKDIIFEGNVATWQDIVDVYNTDCSHGESRIMHKLTDEHVVPGKIRKMKVKNCVQVFSKTVSAALSYTARFPLYPNGKEVSSTMKNTADFLSFMDDLFDSVNGATLLDKKAKSKELRRAVTATTKHHKFWTEAIGKLRKMKFLTKDKKQKTVPSLQNWVVTLKSLLRIWKYLNEKKNVKVMRPRYYNSDPIENFFGQVRAYNYRSNDPSVLVFKNTFKSLLVTRFINFHTNTYNCENDPAQDVLTIQKLFKGINRESATPLEDNIIDVDNVKQSQSHKHLSHEDIQAQARRERLNVHSSAYTVGWVARKLLQNRNCRRCKENLLTTDESKAHEWLKCREYKTKAKKSLAYPTENAVRNFRIVAMKTNEYLEQHAYEQNIGRKIKEKLLAEYSFDFISCNSHRKLLVEDFISTIVKLYIYNWCKIINKILKGVDVIRTEGKTLPKMQNLALHKYKKKLKNKKLNK